MLLYELFTEDYEAQARATSPAPSLEAMTIKKHFGPSSTTEGSIRALSPELVAYGSDRHSSPTSVVSATLPSPPPATRQVSPGWRQGPTEEKPLKSRYQDSLKMHKVSAEGLLEKSKHDDHGKERTKQGSPSQPMEVLSTAQVREKIQQLGMPLAQTGTVPRTHDHRNNDLPLLPGSAGDSMKAVSRQDQEVSPRSLASNRSKTPPKGRGFTLEKYHQMTSSDNERKRESLSPVGSHNASMNGGISPRHSSSEIVHNPQRQSAFSPKSPFSSDLSSGDEAKSDRKQKALALLQQMAAKAKSPDYSAGASSDSSAHMTSPAARQIEEPTPSLDRPPFRIRPPSGDISPRDPAARLSEQQSGDRASLPKSTADREAIRKTVTAQKGRR